LFRLGVQSVNGLSNGLTFGGEVRERGRCLCVPENVTLLDLPPYRPRCVRLRSRILV
jgi:hypothetical protein